MGYFRLSVKMAQKHEFDFDMACEGCSNAAKKVLKKIDVDESQIQIDLPNKKIWVTSDLPVEQLLTTIKKTGKDVSYVGAT